MTSKSDRIVRWIMKISQKKKKTTYLMISKSLRRKPIFLGRKNTRKISVNRFLVPQSNRLSLRGTYLAGSRVLMKKKLVSICSVKNYSQGKSLLFLK